jgi:hypothetical protein
MSAPADWAGGVRPFLPPLPYPMLLGRNPIAIAMMASIVTTRMAAANTSTSYGMAHPSMAGASCQVCTSLQRHLHQSRVADGLGRPARSLLARLSAVGQQPALEQSEDA